MKILFLIPLFFTLLVGCKSLKKTLEFEYQAEKGRLDLYNENHTNKPLVVVIPDVYNSIITEAHITQLAKKNRVLVVYYLASQDKIRLQQIDGLQNRTNYYSSALNSVLTDSEQPSTVIAEGINATIAINLGLNYRQPALVLVNAWHPSMRNIITSTCYAAHTNVCDSLLNYLEFTDRLEADKMLTALKEHGVDKQYGLFTLQVWEDFIDLNSAVLLLNYKSSVRWIYTTNTGLPAHAKAELFSKKGFLKKSTVLSN